MLVSVHCIADTSAICYLSIDIVSADYSAILHIVCCRLAMNSQHMLWICSASRAERVPSLQKRSTEWWTLFSASSRQLNCSWSRAHVKPFSYWDPSSLMQGLSLNSSFAPELV